MYLNDRLKEIVKSEPCSLLFTGVGGAQARGEIVGSVSPNYKIVSNIAECDVNTIYLGNGDTDIADSGFNWTVVQGTKGKSEEFLEKYKYIVVTTDEGIIGISTRR